MKTKNIKIGLFLLAVNHLQMRNCKETDWALKEIYKGDGNTIPIFFRLHKW